MDQPDSSDTTVAADTSSDLLAILEDCCAATGMGFAAVARVTEHEWVAVQVLDRIAFGMKPGDELEISKTICREVRECGDAVVIDSVDGDEHWRTHPVPIMYGFKSYASLPVRLPDNSFYGTLCVIDNEPRRIGAPETVALLEKHARRVGEIMAAYA